MWRFISNMWHIVYICVLVGIIPCYGTVQRAWVDDSGGYRDVVVALSPDVSPGDCRAFFNNLKATINSFSDHLWVATEERLHLSQVDVLLSPNVIRGCTEDIDFIHLAEWQAWDEADIRLTQEGWMTEQYGPIGSSEVGVGVHQPQGCGLPGDFITLSPQLITHLQAQADPQDRLDHLGRALVSAWARYRWGVMEERGYLGNNRYPMVQDDNPTGCNTPETIILENHDFSRSNANTSLLYTVKDPVVWGFCDSSNHDPDAPTPQNLGCRGRSVWDIMRKHSDFIDKIDENPNPDAFENETSANHLNQTYIMSSRAPTYKQAMNVSSGLSKDQIINRSKVPWKRSVQEGDLKVSDDLKKKKRGIKRNAEQKTPQSLELISSDSEPTQTTQGSLNDSVQDTPETVDKDINTESHLRVEANESPLDLQELIPQPIYQSSPRRHKETSESLNIPPTPTIRLISLSSPVIVIALDLSASAVEKVNMEQVRGGLLRWLWGIPHNVRVGIIAAYNNASYPLTVEPLDLSEVQLEDVISLLPYQDEVEDNVYGGIYCLSCVLDEAIKIFESAGASIGSSTLVITACQPAISDHHLSLIKSLELKIHSVALCYEADYNFDQIGTAGSWVVPNMIYSAGKGNAEVNFLKILQDISFERISWPVDQSLIEVQEETYNIQSGNTEKIGPYTSVRQSIQIEPGHGARLLVLTTSSDAKVVKMSNTNDKLQVVRDTPRRFWTTLDKLDVEFNSVLKFLTKSLSFPLSVKVNLYEKKIKQIADQKAVRISLSTNNVSNQPFSVESLPLIVWAEVTQNGRPIRGASVTLVVTLINENGSSNLTMVLLDNGSTEPDLRQGDGIYTRYLTQLPVAGRYSLTAKAHDNFGTASVPLSNSSEDGVQLKKVSTGQFSVTSASMSVSVTHVSPVDLFPPSRITDLAIFTLQDSTFNLTWTAPGGDLDHGTASFYELTMYTERSVLSEEQLSHSVIPFYCEGDGGKFNVIPRPSSHGTPQHCITKVPFTNFRWYFGIRAVDSFNNTGAMSNIVSEWVADLTTVATNPPTDPSYPAQTVFMSTVSSDDLGNITLATGPVVNQWRNYIISGISVLTVLLLIGATIACICCCRRARANAEKDPDRPIYKIYVNNAYIQEEDGEIKVVSNGKVMDDKGPAQVQDWVNSLGKYSGGEALRSEQPDVTANTNDLQLGERSQSSSKFTAPVRFGVLTNGSIMRDQRDASSSSSSSKPSDDLGNDDFKYRDLSETTSNSTTDGGSGDTSSGTNDLQQSTFVEAPLSGHQILGIPVSDTGAMPAQKPGPTVISIHNPNPPAGYSSDEEGGFRPKSNPGPGPRRYLPNQFSSFRYLPPPLEYQSNGLPIIDYPTSHTISRATSTLPHGTVRSVKKRRHISFV